MICVTHHFDKADFQFGYNINGHLICPGCMKKILEKFWGSE